MNCNKLTIGIWGFGRVGQAAAVFFKKRGARIIVYDDDPKVLAHLSFLTSPSIHALFDSTDYILPSPGIDIRAYRSIYQGKWLCEVDMLQHHFNKPVIAITGSVGKTTITHMLVSILIHNGLRVVAAGNIGTPMLSIIDQQDELDMVILELSSFQLEYAQIFAPHVAIWTNLYPNHLDRHTTMEDYFTAKYSLLRNQNATQQALVPYQLQHQILQNKPKSAVTFFTSDCPKKEVKEKLFCITDKNEIHNHRTHKIVSTALLQNTFAQNVVIIGAILELLHIDLQALPKIESIEHRLEKIALINGVTFYNDSKSTTPASTLAAIEQLKNKRILLFLGGLSKGLDRTEFIKQLQRFTVQVFCFGKEASQLQKICANFGLTSSYFQTLETAFEQCIRIAQPNDCVLLSPAGSSFDLFTNYEERGNSFKKLVQRLYT